jgi:hypothetical protein
MPERRLLRVPASSLLVVVIGAMLLAFPAATRAASIDDRTLADPVLRVHAIKQAERDRLMQGARNRIGEVRARQNWLRWKKQHPGRGGAHVRPAPQEEEGLLPLDQAVQRRAAAPASSFSTLAVPANVRCNNPSGDAAGAGQAEESIASLGNFVLVAWNDGQGFNTGGDVQNYAYSTDGGATFIQPAGGIPHPPGATGFRWSSDPLVTVNEKTGEFFYSGLCDSAGISFSGVGVVKATFPGGNAAPVWGTAHFARVVNASQLFIDKEWAAADSASGNLYLSYTLFTATEDSIEFRRSTDGGATWGPIVIMSADTSAGFVQGSRPVTGPNGEVYVTWEQIGIATAADHFVIRKSVDGGLSFSPEVKIDDHFANFGTGAPGFNRLNGVTFPSIAVDRTTGPNRGRLYATWNETIDWFDDPLGGGGSKSEVETNGFFARANAFTIGQRLRGSITASTDVDYFSFAATQGKTYIFWCDSLGAAFRYTMRIFCTDTTTRLGLSGADANSPGQQGFIVWTAPTTATYYLRVAYNGTTGGYRIETGIDAASADDHARDQRDVMISHSDNGTSWSTPVRVDDDLPRFDDWLPEVAVSGDGMPYVIWYDWRDAAANCNGSSNTYISRSSDGGTTWLANQPITSAPTPWTTIPTNIAPNQGDYNGLYGNGRLLHPSWADGRSGEADVNVWSTTLDTGFDITTCAHDTSVTTGTSMPMTFSWANRNVVFANDYTYNLTDDAGWVSSAPTAANVAAGGSKSVNYNVPVPSPAPPGNHFHFTVTNSKGTVVAQCNVAVTVSGNIVAVVPNWIFDVRGAVPNPMIASARIDFTLPRDGQVKLIVFGLRGERVRTLVDGMRGAGPNSATWDGRDDHGRRVGAGEYFYRLESLGRVATRRLVILP